MKKVIILFIFSLTLFAKGDQMISMRKFLNDYSVLHKNVNFFILKNDNKKSFINKKNENKYLKYDIQTLKYFLETKLNATINFKTLNLEGKKIIFLQIQKNRKPDNPITNIIQQLKNLKKYGQKVSIINPDFDYKEYQNDINIIIKKLKTYEKIHN